MPNTRGFEVVAEVSVDVLREILRAAWKSGADPNAEGVIPEAFDIPAGLAFGPYVIQDGTVQIPKDQLDLTMATDVNGVDIKLGTIIQVHIQNPPIPSASLFDMTADVRVKAPVNTIDGTNNVGVILEGLPRPNVRVTLTSGDPIGPITLEMIREYVHEKYEDGTIPATITQTGISLGVFTADAFIEIFDDSSDPNHQITVSQPAPNQVKLRIPIHLRLSNISAPAGPQPLSPMGVEAKIAVTAPLVMAPGSITAQLTAATVDVEDLVSAPGVEGTNYNVNKAGASALGIDLENLMKNEIRMRGQAIVSSIGDITFSLPTVSQIETFIGDQVHAEVLRRRYMGVWTPETPEGGGVTVENITIKALSDVLAIALNRKNGADANALTNFIPAGRGFAIAMDGAKVIEVIWETIRRPESEGGFGPDFPPKRFTDVNGHDADLTSLDISLRTNAIHVEGDVTVIDAIFGSIDVDADFEVDVGLRWEDNPDGTQKVVPVPGEPDVDLSLLAWILSFLFGLITFGIIGGVIALVVLFIVESIAEKVGGQIIRDDITGQVKGIGAWPQELLGIGTVTSRFENPIGIDPDGLLFSG